MTDLDLERLGDVWRQQPDPAELERLQRTARSVSRRARLQQFVDMIIAAAVAAVVLLLVASSPRLETVVMGSAAILVLLVSNIRLRRLRQVELRSLSGSTEEMLDQSIERAETTLRYNRITIVALAPVVGLSLLFMATADAGKIGEWRQAISNDPVVGVVWFAASLAILAGIGIFNLVSARRNKRALERLRALRSSYRTD